VPFNTNNKIELVDASGDPLDLGSGVLSTETLRVTLATDDPHWGTVGTAGDVDGTAHGQLRYIGDLAANLAELPTIKTYLNTAQSVLAATLSTTGGQYTEGDGGFLATGVRNNTLGTLVSVNGDHAPFQVNADGALYTTHGITGMVSGVNSTVSDSTAEQLDGSTSGLDIACKRVDLMATQSNTGDIWVGDSGVTSNGAGGGMQLNPGDFYSIDVNNLNDIWVIATVDEENIHFTYFT